MTLFPDQPFPVHIDDRLDFGHLLGDYSLCSLGEIRIVEERSHIPQGFDSILHAQVVDLQPGNAVFLLHHAIGVVDGAVAEQDVQLGPVGFGDIVEGSVACEGADYAVAHSLQQILDHPVISADVVLPEYVHVEWPGVLQLLCAHQVLHQRIGGDVVAR